VGIFGARDLDLATRWTTPDPATPTYQAMKMFRNYDGKKSTFGETSIATTTPNPDNVSAFAARRASDGAITVVAVTSRITAARQRSRFHQLRFARHGQALAVEVFKPDPAVARL